MTFRTRLGPTLESELGNTWPIVKIFRDWEFELPLDWSSVERIVEIGGHVGAFALWAAAHAPSARIVSFEPEPRNFQDLRSNVERNGLSDRIVAVNAAAAAAAGRRTFDVPLQRSKAAFASPAAEGSVEVDCVPLERYLDDEVPERIHVLKLDCEGAEWEILPSLSDKTYDRIRNVIVGCHAQTHRQVDEMRELLGERGFASRIVSTGSDRDFALLATIWGERR